MTGHPVRAGGAASAALLLCGLALLPGQATAEAACAVDRVDLRGPGGRQSFAVEVADSAAERALGLMYRDSLPADSGMLFVYETPRQAQFWMENTRIPLDMIFADSRGVVTRVAADAVPMDRTVIDGGPGVQFVLEINAGLAARLGIAPGTELRHPALGDEARWPCR